MIYREVVDTIFRIGRLFRGRKLRRFTIWFYGKSLSVSVLTRLHHRLPAARLRIGATYRRWVFRVGMGAKGWMMLAAGCRTAGQGVCKSLLAPLIALTNSFSSHDYRRVVLDTAFIGRLVCRWELGRFMIRFYGGYVSVIKYGFQC